MHGATDKHIGSAASSGRANRIGSGSGNVTKRTHVRISIAAHWRSEWRVCTCRGHGYVTHTSTHRSAHAVPAIEQRQQFQFHSSGIDAACLCATHAGMRGVCCICCSQPVPFRVTVARILEQL